MPFLRALTAIAFLPVAVHASSVPITVHDAFGSPVRGAKARLLSLDRVFEARANAEGRLQFEGVAPGTYDLEVTAPAFISRTLPSVLVSSSDPAPLDVGLKIASQPDHCGYVNTVDYSAITPEARGLAGKVIDEDSRRGLGGVKIELLGTETGSSVPSVISGRDGSFAISDLPPGRYGVRASKDAYWPATIEQFVVPRENLIVLHLALDKRGHMHICQ